jgi:integrase
MEDRTRRRSQRGRREWGYVRKQGTKSGRYQASYIGPDLRRHFAPVTFSSKMNAEAWLAKEKDLIEKATYNQDYVWQPPEARKLEKKAQALTLAEYSALWIEQRKLKPRTRIGYQASLRNHIEPKLGRIAIRDLTPAAVRSWFSSLGTANPTRNGHAYGLLHAICATAVKDELLVRNPCMIERAMNPPTKRKAVIPTIGELEALADKIGSDERTARFRVLVLLSAWCGLRWGEVTELQRKDFDSDCAVVTIARAVTHRGCCRIDTPKDNKPARVVIPPDMRDDIKSHLAHHVSKEPDSLLFTPARGGCHVNDQVFAKDVFKPACKTVGLEQMRVHDLRHFAGTMTARVGNLPETMARLRHSTVKASIGYQSQVSGRDIAVAEALSAVRTETIAGQDNCAQTSATES